MTPRDEYVFVGDPPLWRPPASEVHISVAFTWDIEKASRLALAWGQYGYKIKVGGPAFGDLRDSFTPGFYIQPGVTFTSRGCDNNCPWCLVPANEGGLRLLEIKPGHIIQDNNLLQTGRAHMSKVFAMLKAQPRGAKFSGGLDSELVTDWVADELRGLRVDKVFLSADTEDRLSHLWLAVHKLRFLPRRKLRCYVLLAYENETLEWARDRLEAVWQIGCLPFAQLYQPPQGYIRYNDDWKALARTWSRPAAMFALHNEVSGA